MKKGTLQKRVCRSLTQKLRHSAGIFLFFALIAQASIASISHIEALLSQADYRKALLAISLELKNQELSSEAKTKLHWLKGVCHVSEGQTQLAKSSFSTLLAIAPGYVPAHNTSPKILKIFEDVQATEKVARSSAPVLKTSLVSVEHFVSGEPVSFQIRFDDTSLLTRIDRVELHLRKLGNSEYSTLDFRPLDPSGLYEAMIPPILTKHLEHDASFEYYVDVIAKDGTLLGHVGSSTQALHLVATLKAPRPTLEDSEDKPGFIKSALLIGAAAAAIGGVILMVVVLSAPTERSLNIRAYLPGG